MVNKNDIQKLRKSGKTFREIAEIYNCSFQRIAQICPGPINPDLVLSWAQRRKRAIVAYKARAKAKAKRDAYQTSPEGIAAMVAKRKKRDRYKWWDQHINQKRKDKTPTRAQSARAESNLSKLT